MVYVTGDIHGNQEKWIHYIDPILKEQDILLVTGDFGMGFWYGPEYNEEQFLDWLQTRCYTVCFIDRNHENFNLLNTYPVKKWNGGNVHFIRKNVIHLLRGEVFTIENHTYFVFGGGFSIDKKYRLQDISWWIQEMPVQKEYENAKNNLIRYKYNIDYILTHTAPNQTIYYLKIKNKIKDAGLNELELNLFLDSIYQRSYYSHWYFGHFHMDQNLWRNQTVIFNSIRNIYTNEIITQWDFCDG